MSVLCQPPAAIAVHASPYPHTALTPAFADYDGLVADFPAEDRFASRIRMHGDLTAGDAEYDRLVEASSSYRALHDWIYSPDFVRAFLEIFDETIESAVKAGELLFDPRTLPIRAEPYEGRRMIGMSGPRTTDAFLFPRLDLGIGLLDYGKVNGGGGIHVDNVTRLMSALLYIDRNPTMIGGEHRLYRLQGTRPVIDKVYPPEPNLMVASLQSNVALHDVNPVTAIEGCRKALYFAVSCSLPIWRPHSDRALQSLTKNRYRPSTAERLLRRVKKVIAGGPSDPRRTAG